MENKNICENCGNYNDNSYGSGRFCCQKCARSFSTKNIEKYKKSNCKQCGKQMIITKKSTKQLCDVCKETKYVFCCICENCGKQFEYHSKRNRKRKTCSIHCAQSLIGKSAWNETHRQNMMSIFKKSFECGNRPCRGGKTKRYLYKNIIVQGTYQLRVCYILDNLLDKNKIFKWEYTNDKIKYKWKDGTQHLYYPDFKVINNDGTCYYLQIKGFEKQIDKLKWEQTRQQGYNLVVWFQKDIVALE